MHDVYTTNRWKAMFTGAFLSALHVQVLVGTALSGCEQTVPMHLLVKLHASLEAEHLQHTKLNEGVSTLHQF